MTIAEGVLQNGGTSGAAYSLSSDGRTLAYIPHPAGSRQFERRLVWVDRQGKIEPLPAPPRAYSALALASDGQQAAFEINTSTAELWIYDLARSSLTRLTSEQGSSRSPLWTPDGSRVAYRGIRTGGQNLYWRSADGSGSEERLTTSDNNQAPSSWSPDGKVLAYQEASPATGQDIWTLALEGDRKPRPFLQTASNELASMFSPDGRWLAYVSNESSGNQVYVQPFPGPGRKWQISTDGGEAPQWNPNGRELFYRSGNSTMVVDVTTSPTFTASRPRLLYQGPAGDSSPDGQRFLAIQAVEPEQTPTQIHIMLNWPEKLNRRPPQ
jgi:serine/threonine-protein kinase